MITNLHTVCNTMLRQKKSPPLSDFTLKKVHFKEFYSKPKKGPLIFGIQVQKGPLLGNFTLNQKSPLLSVSH